VNQAQSNEQQPAWAQQPPAPDQGQGQSQNRNLNLNLSAGGSHQVKQERGGSPEVKEEEDEAESQDSDIEITGWRVLKPARRKSSRAAVPEANTNSRQTSGAVETPRQLAYRPLPTPTSLGASTPGARAPPRPSSQGVQSEVAEPTRAPAEEPSPAMMMDMMFAMQISFSEQLEQLKEDRMVSLLCDLFVDPGRSGC
jgi:hypothetical protein